MQAEGRVRWRSGGRGLYNFNPSKLQNTKVYQTASALRHRQQAACLGAPTGCGGEHGGQHNGGGAAGLDVAQPLQHSEQLSALLPRHLRSIAAGSPLCLRRHAAAGTPLSSPSTKTTKKRRD